MTLPASDSFEMRLMTHCGVRFAVVNGEAWETRPINDGHGNPVAPWNSQPLGQMHILDRDIAVFVAEGYPPLYFHPYEGDDAGAVCM